MRRRSLRNAQQGFTLIEMMITVAVLGILVSLAYPSYTAYVARARRASATAALSQAAQYVERNMTAFNCYNYAAVNECIAGAGTTLTTLPANMLVAPAEGAPSYNIALTATANTYVLAATPIGSQSSDACGVLVINQTGAKGANNTIGDPMTATCWGG